MNGPNSIGKDLLSQVEKAGGADITLSWDDFYSMAGVKDGYITPAFMDRVNTVLKPKGYVSIKNDRGVLIRHLH